MEQYRVMAKYRSHGPEGQKRVYHASDVDHTGPSVSLQAFHQGERPPVPAPAPARARCLTYRGAPTNITWAEFAQLRAEVERHVASQRARRAALTGLECRHCHRVSCRCGVPEVPHTMEEALKLQQAHRQR